MRSTIVERRGSSASVGVLRANDARGTPGLLPTRPRSARGRSEEDEQGTATRPRGPRPRGSHVRRRASRGQRAGCSQAAPSPCRALGSRVPPRSRRPSSPRNGGLREPPLPPRERNRRLRVPGRLERRTRARFNHSWLGATIPFWMRTAPVSTKPPSSRSSTASSGCLDETCRRKATTRWPFQMLSPSRAGRDRVEEGHEALVLGVADDRRRGSNRGAPHRNEREAEPGALCPGSGARA